MKEYEIYVVRGNEYLGKARPSVLVQRVNLDDFHSVTVVPFTSSDANSEFRIKVEPSQTNGLEKASYLMIDKISTVAKDQLGPKVGQLEEKYIEELKKELFNYLIGGTDM
jgi:mRNA interferase MazF